MADYLPGDQVMCLICDKVIVNATATNYDTKFVFDVITTYAEGIILYVPIDLDLIDCMELTAYNCDRFNIDRKFLGSLSYYISEYKVLRLYSQIDGMCCARCKDFFPMSGPNQSN